MDSCSDKTVRPKLSIVIPAYNRESCINRAIVSCLISSRKDIEVIVVDDSSTDRSLEVIRTYADPRLSVVALPQNVGVCAARGAGTEIARGEWVGFLDSDDELAPNCIDALISRLEEVPADIGGFYSRRVHRGGGTPISPALFQKTGQLSAEEYYSLMEKNYFTSSDMFCCMKRKTFEQLTWPTTRGPEMEYHFRFARLFGILFSDDAFYICHHDSVNQITKSSHFDIETELSYARAYWRILTAEGDALKRHAPKLRQRILIRMVVPISAAEGRSKLFSALRTSEAFPPGFKLTALIAVCLISPTLAFRLKNHSLWKELKNVRAR